jgi:hypothetical protein
VLAISFAAVGGGLMGKPSSVPKELRGVPRCLRRFVWLPGDITIKKSASKPKEKK